MKPSLHQYENQSMLGDPKLFYAIANYNNERFLPELISSLLSQTDSNWSAGIIDDCSTDGSVEILQKIKDPRISVIYNSSNLGVAGALNKLIFETSSDWVAIVDSDDVLDPKNCEVIRKALNRHRHENISLIYTNFYYCDEKLNIINKGFCKEIAADESAIDNDCVSHTKIYNRSSFLKVGGYDTNFTIGEDKDVIFKLEEVGSLLFIDEQLYLYRQRKGSLTNQLANQKEYYLKLAIEKAVERRNGTKPSLDTVSIIIPIKNRYDYRINNLLKSIRNQRYDQTLIEIVLVDYGSDEKHYQTFMALCHQYDIKGVWTKIREVWSRSHCLNIGIKQSTSKYLLMTDVDIVFKNNYLEVCLESIGKDAKQAFYCKALDLPQGCVTEETDCCQQYEELKKLSFYRGDGLDSTFRFGIGILFIEAKLVKRIGAYDEFYKLWGLEDADLIKRIEQIGIAVKDIGNKTSYIHQWHEKFENVGDLHNFEKQKRLNQKYYSTQNSINRNPSGWGSIEIADSPDNIPECPQKLPGSLWAITTFFNPAQYQNKYENFQKFRASSKQQGLNLAAVELAFEDNPFELNNVDADILIQLRAERNNILWQKEALLNIGLKNLPKDCDKIIWIDCDIIFKNDTWVRDTSELLEKYVAVQPFESVIFLDKDQIDFQFIEEAPKGIHFGGKFHGIGCGVATAGAKTLVRYLDHGHPGFVWAARREIFNEIGLYDRLILGSADLIMVYSFYNNNNEASKRVLITESLRKDRDPWAKAMHARVNSSVYFTSGTILHLWHGDFQNRAYASRDLILKQNNFNPSKDIIKNEIGIWEWASDKPALHQSVRNYFFQRKENISEPKLPSSSSNASDSLPYAFNTADKSWGQKLFACLDQCYITFLNICGQNLKRNFPSLYYRLKKYFPDRVVEKS